MMIPSKPIVRVLGTSHIAQQSIAQIKAELVSFSPNFVCVELDRQRAESLMRGDKAKVPPLRAISQLGIAGYVFSVFGGIVQKKLGHLVGTSPGADMKTAIVEGSASGARVILIDRSIAITLRRFSQLFSFREKTRFFFDLIFPWRVKKKGVRFDLRTVPKDELIGELLGVFEERYPGLYRALLTERNEFMVKRIKQVAQSFPGAKILVVVGAGHKKGMMELLEKNLDISLI